MRVRFPGSIPLQWFLEGLLVARCPNISIRHPKHLEILKHFGVSALHALKPETLNPKALKGTLRVPLKGSFRGFL